jgi:hypothetical protein
MLGRPGPRWLSRPDHRREVTMTTSKDPGPVRDPGAILDELGALWSPDFGAYASGQLPADQVRCVLCLTAPCGCPPFGSPEYMALIDARHGRAGDAR